MPSYLRPSKLGTPPLHEQSIGHAAEQHPILSRLLPLAAASREMLQIVQPVLPPALANAVLPGKWDDTTWTLLARSSAVAAKLQQLTPQMLATLTARGRNVTAIKVRVQELRG
jgi:hypothetical protein